MQCLYNKNTHGINRVLVPHLPGVIVFFKNLSQNNLTLEGLLDVDKIYLRLANTNL